MMNKQIKVLRRSLEYVLSLLLIGSAVLGFQSGARLEPLMCAGAAVMLVLPAFERIFRERGEESWWNVGALVLGCLLQLEGLSGLAKTPESLNLITVSMILGLVTDRKYLKVLWVLFAAVELVLAL